MHMKNIEILASRVSARLFGVADGHPLRKVYDARDQYMSAWSRRILNMPVAWRKNERGWATKTVAWLTCAAGHSPHVVADVMDRDPEWVVAACGDVDARRAQFPDFAAWMDYVRGAPVTRHEQITPWPGTRSLTLAWSRPDCADA